MAKLFKANYLTSRDQFPNFSLDRAQFASNFLNMGESARQLQRASLANIKEDLNTFSKSLETSFASNDYRLTLPTAAISLIVARSGGGKTSFMLNLLLDCLKRYEGKRFYFLSYEEPSAVLAVKLLLILSQLKVESHEADNFLHFLELSKRLPWTDDPLAARHSSLPKKLIDAYKTLSGWNKNDLLYLCDPQTSIDMLVKAFKAQTARERVEIGGVFVDYIQRVRVDDEMAKENRYLQLKHISQQLLQIAELTTAPVVVGSQYNAARTEGKYAVSVIDAIRESTDVVFDANLVVHILQPGDTPEAGDDKNVPKQKLKSHGLQILKNRFGRKGQVVPLTFSGPTMTFEVAATSSVSSVSKVSTKLFPEAGPGEKWKNLDGSTGPGLVAWATLEHVSS